MDSYYDIYHFISNLHPYCQEIYDFFDSLKFICDVPFRNCHFTFDTKSPWRVACPKSKKKFLIFYYWLYRKEFYFGWLEVWSVLRFLLVDCTNKRILREYGSGEQLYVNPTKIKCTSINLKNDSFHSWTSWFFLLCSFTNVSSHAHFFHSSRLITFSLKLTKYFNFTNFTTKSETLVSQLRSNWLGSRRFLNSHDLFVLFRNLLSGKDKRHL